MNQPCEVCDARHFRRVFSKVGYDFFRCLDCGHVAIQLGISDADLVRLYETEFFTNGSYVDYLGDRAILKKNFARFLNRLHVHAVGGRLLDIGCAYGFFLDLARDRWEVEGVDVAGPPTTFAKEQLRLNVRCGEFMTMPLAANHYDVVTMWDTIEHLRHPAAYLAKVSAILKPNGVLALTTGDVRSLAARIQGKGWRLYDPPFHIHYFSHRTLSRLLARYGFEVLEITYAGFSRSLNTILHRVFAYQKPPLLRLVYRAAQQLRVTRYDVYMNVFDIMLVFARKTGQRPGLHASGSAASVPAQPG